MSITSQEIIQEIFQFLVSDLNFQEPEKATIAHENYLTYSNGKFQIEIIDEGDWSFPFITIKNNSGNYLPLPDNWFTPKGLQNTIASDYNTQRNLNWLSTIDKKTIEYSNYPLTGKILDQSNDSFYIRGNKIITIYLLVVSKILKSQIDEIPLLFENSIIKKIKNYLQQWL